MPQHDGIFVIFGITGDLAKRKLLAALYHLANSKVLAEEFTILGTTRRQTTVDEIIGTIRQAIINGGEQPDEATLENLRSKITMVNMDINNQADYRILKEAIDAAEQHIGRSVNRLHYLAVPPEMFVPVISGLGSADLHIVGEGYENRLLVEKPFGRDTDSAIKLIEHMEKDFSEDQIYRVDHYLAKETVQNIMTFRFDNPLFQAVWDHATIDHVLITAAENIGIEGRVNFYEQTGALRDLIQSHLLQLLALVAMEEPAGRSADAIHAAKTDLLESITPIRADQVETHAARGQYDSYLEEVGNADSLTESYAAIRLEIDNDRWRGVPILLRAGKAMAEKITEISLVFSNREKSKHKNVLTIRIQPNEGIVLSLRAKAPSLQDETHMVQMEFRYNQAFDRRQPDAYERVLIDAIRGDKTLFTTDQEVLTSWKIIEAVLQAWSVDGKGMETYQTGSWGPASAEKLADNAQASWLTETLQICPPVSKQ